MLITFLILSANAVKFNKLKGKTPDSRIIPTVRRIRYFMKITKELYFNSLEAGGFVRDESFPDCDENQFQYLLDSSVGSGKFHVYCLENMFAIESYDLRFNKDTLIETPEPEFMSLQYYSSVSGEELHPYRQLSPNSLRAYIGQNRTKYQAIFHKDIPVRAVSFSVMPEFYKGYLKEKLDGEDIELQSAFRRMTGGVIQPQLTTLLKQIQSYNGFGACAKLFYEGKILEAVAIVADEARQCKTQNRAVRLTKEDEDNLNAAARYIENHFAFGVNTDQLCRIALMGSTKLKTAFKEYFGCSISEYTIRKRIDHAQHLLIATDLSVGEIAKAVGYERSDSFSSQFSRITGLLPTEYRELISR